MDIETIQDANLNKINDMLKDEDEINVMFSNAWTEHESVIFLQHELNKYRGILDASGITTKDKRVSYDGMIEVTNNASEKGSEWIGTIDVQVKGTCVDKIDKGNIKFPVKVTDLENYVKHPLGVLFFVIQIDKKTLEKKIFYRFLLPVDLEEIFTKIKPNQETKSIDFFPIDSNKKTMLKNVCLKFLKARKMQVNKRIVMLDEKVKPLEIFIQDFTETNEEYLKNKVYTYIKLHDDEGFIPAIIPTNGKLEKIEIINKPIVIDNVEYYKSYKKITEENDILYKCGKNIEYSTKDKKINFKFDGTLDEMINDMKFILKIINSTEAEEDKLREYIQKRLSILIEFKKNLQKININLTNQFTQFENIDYMNINHFNNLINNNKETVKKIDGSKVYIIKLCKKDIVLFLVKNNIELKVYNFFDNFSEKFTITMKTENEYIDVCPYNLLIDNVIFENILNFNKNSVSIAIKNSKDSSINRDYMNLLALSLINSYDNTLNNDFYDLAKVILENLLNWNPNENIYIINKLQLIKRKRDLNNEEITLLYEIKNKEVQNSKLQYGISILLENKSDIDYYYDKLDDKTKEEILKYPIENLKKDKLNKS